MFKLKNKRNQYFLRGSCPHLGLALLLLLLLLSTLTLATLGLDVLVVDSESLVNLGLESGIILDAVNVLAGCTVMVNSRGAYRVLTG